LSVQPDAPRRGDPARKAVEIVLKKHLFDASEEEMRAMVQEFLDSENCRRLSPPASYTALSPPSP
jgi:hypothetical protein